MWKTSIFRSMFLKWLWRWFKILPTFGCCSCKWGITHGFWFLTMVVSVIYFILLRVLVPYITRWNKYYCIELNCNQHHMSTSNFSTSHLKIFFQISILFQYTIQSTKTPILEGGECDSDILIYRTLSEFDTWYVSKVRPTTLNVILRIP